MEAKTAEKDKDKITSDKLQKEYNNNVKLARNAEPVTKSWVDMACKVYDEALSIEEVLEVVISMDNMHGAFNPFDGIDVLHGFVSKAKTKGAIIWVFKAMHDLLDAKELRLQELNSRSMIGDTHNKGYIDLLLTQMHFKEYLLGPVLAEIGVKSEVVDLIRLKLGSHSDYRASMTALPTTEVAANCSWMAGMDPALLTYIQFVEDGSSSA